MSVLSLSVLLIVVSIIILLLVFKVLIASGWFMKWLRGTSGMLLLAAVLIVGLLSYELMSFDAADEGEVVATLTFNKLDKQEFNAELVDAHGNRFEYRLLGDQWQLDVKLVSVKLLGNMGQPSYKLDRISGRYLSLEQEKSDQKSVYRLENTNTKGFLPQLLDFQWFGILNASYGSAAFMPMEEGAIYQVRLYKKGVLAEPINDRAKSASEQW